MAVVLWSLSGSNGQQQMRVTEMILVKLGGSQNKMNKYERDICPQKTR